MSNLGGQEEHAVKDYYDLLGIDRGRSTADILSELERNELQYDALTSMPGQDGAALARAQQQLELIRAAKPLFATEEARQAYNAQLQDQNTSKRPVNPWIRKAWDYLYGGKLDLAEIAVHKALQEGVDILEARIVAGELSIARGNLDEATEHVQEAQVLADAAGPNNTVAPATAYLVASELAFKKGEGVSAAVALLDHGLTLNPAPIAEESLLQRRAILLFSCGRGDQAVSSIVRMLELSETSGVPAEDAQWAQENLLSVIEDASLAAPSLSADLDGLVTNQKMIEASAMPEAIKRGLVSKLEGMQRESIAAYFRAQLEGKGDMSRRQVAARDALYAIELAGVSPQLQTWARTYESAINVYLNAEAALAGGTAELARRQSARDQAAQGVRAFEDQRDSAIRMLHNQEQRECAQVPGAGTKKEFGRVKSVKVSLAICVVVGAIAIPLFWPLTVVCALAAAYLVKQMHDNQERWSAADDRSSAEYERVMAEVRREQDKIHAAYQVKERELRAAKEQEQKPVQDVLDARQRELDAQRKPVLMLQLAADVAKMKAREVGRTA